MKRSTIWLRILGVLLASALIFAGCETGTSEPETPPSNPEVPGENPPGENPPEDNPPVDEPEEPLEPELPDQPPASFTPVPVNPPTPTGSPGTDLSSPDLTVSAWQSGAGPVNVTVGGFVPASYQYILDRATSSALPVDGGAGWASFENTGIISESGSYALVNLEGLFTDEMKDHVIGIKQTNPALASYYSSGYGNENRVDDPKPVTTDILYLTGGTAVRWRLYDIGTIDSSESLSVLIKEGGASISLEIQSYSEWIDGAAPTNIISRTVVIDYSSVEFQ
jgi:hypothetical protein